MFFVATVPFITLIFPGLLPSTGVVGADEPMTREICPGRGNVACVDLDKIVVLIEVPLPMEMPEFAVSACSSIFMLPALCPNTDMMLLAPIDNNPVASSRARTLLPVPSECCGSTANTIPVAKVVLPEVFNEMPALALIVKPTFLVVAKFVVAVPISSSVTAPFEAIILLLKLLFPLVFSVIDDADIEPKAMDCALVAVTLVDALELRFPTLMLPVFRSASMKEPIPALLARIVGALTTASTPFAALNLTSLAAIVAAEEIDPAPTVLSVTTPALLMPLLNVVLPLALKLMLPEALSPLMLVCAKLESLILIDEASATLILLLSTTKALAVLPMLPEEVTKVILPLFADVERVPLFKMFPLPEVRLIEAVDRPPNETLLMPPAPELVSITIVDALDNEEFISTAEFDTSVKG